MALYSGAVEERFAFMDMVNDPNTSTSYNFHPLAMEDDIVLKGTLLHAISCVLH